MAGVDKAGNSTQRVITNDQGKSATSKDEAKKVGGGKAGPSGPDKSAPTPAVTDTVVTTAQAPAADAGKTSLERRVEELEANYATLEEKYNKAEEARQARETKAAEDAKKPGFFRTVMEIFDLFNRFFNPLYNLACAAFRLIRIAWDYVVHNKSPDWSKEGPKLLAEIGGAALQIMMPGTGALVGGALSAGVEGYMNWTHNESEIMGGANKLTDDSAKEYGIKRTLLGAENLVTEIYGGAKRLVTGKDDRKDDGVSPLNPAETTI
ncbi:MAG: hypothetical protein HY903_06330 [Deltaproteobacteria bacterium]|nr:hypothetical protein [Deltaproteobacteria bacterium]